MQETLQVYSGCKEKGWREEETGELQTYVYVCIRSVGSLHTAASIIDAFIDVMT